METGKSRELYAHFKPACWQKLIWRFQTSARFCSSAKRTQLYSTKPQWQKKWVHLALAHVKSDNSNLSSSLLTSPVSAEQKHVYVCVCQCGGEPAAGSTESWSGRCRRCTPGGNQRANLPLRPEEAPHLARLPGYKAAKQTPREEPAVTGGGC